MAFINFKPQDYFQTMQYTGNDANNRTITGVGFQADWSVIKAKDNNVVWNVFDSVRGDGKRLQFNGTGDGLGSAQGIKSWNSDGFVIGTNGDANSNGQVLQTYNWKAGTTSGVTGGSITPHTYSYDASRGFSIMAYAGNGSNGATIPHMLGEIPDAVIVKKYDGNVKWYMYHASNGSNPHTKYLTPNDTNASQTQGGWNNTAPTNTVVTVADGSEVNASGSNYIMYSFKSIKGHSMFSGYIGTGNASISSYNFCGFKPALVIVKNISASGDWYVFDNQRSASGGDNEIGYNLRMNKSEAQSTGSNYGIDFTSNGWKMRNTNGEMNASGNDFVYMAWAENPMIGSGGTVGVAV